ncbi:MAG: class I SAM-dependent methyltransferase [Actinobacteria bacterium]|nr:class I SAM-dependent methyltransferase [Actinomycetota bacterium]
MSTTTRRPRPGTACCSIAGANRAIDLGCGFGETTLQLAQMVGPDGEAVGVDVADRFVAQAREEAAEAGIENARFVQMDVQYDMPEGPFDYAFGRMGTAFFSNPGSAMRNLQMAMRPGGKLCKIVWRAKIENEWFWRTEQIVDRYVERPDPDDSDEPTCGPGPFSMANADTVSGILKYAGFDRISLRRLDMPVSVGKTVERAVEAALAIGPAAETVRLSGDRAEAVRADFERDLTELAQEYLTPDGVVVTNSAWVVTAEATGA